MTQNLRLINKTISDIDSDLSSGYFTVPESNARNFKSTDNSSNAAYVDEYYGGYYTWFAASAGSRSSDKSICPKGWRIPSLAEYDSLSVAYQRSVALISVKPVPGFELGGWYSGAETRSRTSEGWWWSSNGNSSCCNTMWFDNGTRIDTDGNCDTAYQGINIRCIKK